MRYSEIIEGYYQIFLSKHKKVLVDAFSVGASHHRYRCLLSTDPAQARFHHDLYLKHLRALYAVIFGGDFKNAQDLSGAGFELRRMWNPDRLPLKASSDRIEPWEDALLPQSSMYSEMCADRRFLSGEEHPYDVVLENPLMVFDITRMLITYEPNLAVMS